MSEPTTGAYRTVVLYVADSTATDELRHLLTVAKNPPWHPSERRGGPQERWTDEEVDAYALTLLRRISGRVEWAGALLAPSARDD